MNGYTIHNILSRFIHGMRFYYKYDAPKFYLSNVFSFFTVPYLEVSFDNFSLLFYDFLLDLSKAKILTYCSEDDSITFNSEYKDYLNELFSFSFEIMFLGFTKNKEFDCFIVLEKSEDFERRLTKLHSDYLSCSYPLKKKAISDMFLSTTIFSFVEIISYPNVGINNFIIDNIVVSLLEKKKQSAKTDLIS